MNPIEIGSAMSHGPGLAKGFLKVADLPDGKDELVLPFIRDPAERGVHHLSDDLLEVTQ